jgi:hypothetical protein
MNYPAASGGEYNPKGLNDSETLDFIIPKGTCLWE